MNYTIHLPHLWVHIQNNWKRNCKKKGEYYSIHVQRSLFDSIQEVESTQKPINIVYQQNKQCCIIQQLKRKNILSQGTTFMNLEDIMLNKTS